MDKKLVKELWKDPSLEAGFALADLLEENNRPKKAARWRSCLEWIGPIYRKVMEYQDKFLRDRKVDRRYSTVGDFEIRNSATCVLVRIQTSPYRYRRQYQLAHRKLTTPGYLKKRLTIEYQYVEFFREVDRLRAEQEDFKWTFYSGEIWTTLPNMLLLKFFLKEDEN